MQSNKVRHYITDDYAALLGRAVFVFGYYEWIIIFLVRMLGVSDFVETYCRGEKPMTSGGVRKMLEGLIKNPSTDFSASPKVRVESVLIEFGRLVEQRNRLIHAHPCYTEEGAHILLFQGPAGRQPSDVQWPPAEIERFITEIESAVPEAHAVYTAFASAPLGKLSPRP